MKKLTLIILTLIQLSVYSQDNVVLPEGNYPYWPTYTPFNINTLKDIIPQSWITTNNVKEGWDWSMPSFVEPSNRSSIAFQRKFGTDDQFTNLNLQFQANSTGLLWVSWKELEPTMNNYNFTALINSIQQANSVGVKVSLRILCHSYSNGHKADSLSKGDAPSYLKGLGCKLLPRKEYTEANLNYNPADPTFHVRYLKLISEIAKTNIPDLVRNMYIGYASPAYGDEGIGPYGDNSTANDTVKHVRERLDAWQDAFVGQENKVYMGGSVDYGFQKGFGARKGFIEMYHYNVPNPDWGSYVDSKGYFCIDENAPLNRYNCMKGEVNEEYQVSYSQAPAYRYGISTISFSYRYFMSMMRVLQMRCTYVHDGGALVPEMIPFIAQELGRTVEDAPDVLAFLNTCYLKKGNYEKYDWQNPKRTYTAKEISSGIEAKNYERWLNQRDTVGYETTPDMPIQQAIKMWMIQTDSYTDYIARSGKKIGFYIDDRWASIDDSLAVKITYFDNYSGAFKLIYHNGTIQTSKTQSLSGDGKLKTTTFFIPKIKPNSLPFNFDFTLEAGTTTEKIVVSMVRVVKAKESFLSALKDVNNDTPKRVSVYPNPATDVLNIEHVQDATIQIYDMGGAFLYKEKTSGRKTTVDVSKFKKSKMLLLHVISANNSEFVKVIVE